MDWRHDNLTGFEGGVPTAWNELTRTIIAAAMEVHNFLEAGLPEAAYERAMVLECRRRGLDVAQQVRFDVRFKRDVVGLQVLDLVIEGLVAVELKAVETVSDLHLAQLVGYLHVSDLPLGLLINFNVVHLRDGIYRRLNSRSTRLRLPRPNPPSASSM
jgi:GxxExxY protein